MNILDALILGIIQGLTEFIPVSSSGHLAIAQSMIKNFNQPGVLFDSILHLGTLCAVLIYFRKESLKIINNKKLLLFILLATIPTGIIGVLFNDVFEKMFSNVKLVSIALIITGAVVFVADRFKEGGKDIKEMKWYDPILIGLIQGIAIIPGISRSGSTISGGIFLKLNKKFAMEFSFLLSIPAILGAVFLQARHLTGADLQDINITAYIFGFLTAAIVGYFSMKVLLSFLQKQKMYFFSIYCWIIGIIVLLLT